MTVYVDDYRVPATVGRVTARWSHMFAGPFDDITELHAVADVIGMRRDWFQAKPWPGQRAWNRRPCSNRTAVPQIGGGPRCAKMSLADW